MGLSSEGKILFISDVHGLVPHMNEFFSYILKKHNNEIDFAVHLGDFWSGRNYRGNSQVFDEWDNLKYFEKLEIPVFLLRGNEDLKIPEEWWRAHNLWLMEDQEPFQLNKYRVLPIDYKFTDQGLNAIKHPDIAEKEKIDIILSHIPPFGLLDDTLHYRTHQKLRLTGSELVRYYVDQIHPILTVFGHFHYSNYLLTNFGLIACLDKLVRFQDSRFQRSVSQKRYSYAILDCEEEIFSVFWRNKLFYHYSLKERQIVYIAKSLMKTSSSLQFSPSLEKRGKKKRVKKNKEKEEGKNHRDLSVPKKPKNYQEYNKKNRRKNSEKIA